MKTTKTATSLPTAAVCAALLGWTAPAQSALVDFNTPGDLATHFNSTATVPASHYNEADLVGVGGTRGLQVTSTTPPTGGVNDAGSTLKTSSLSFANVGDMVEVSAFVHTVPQIGTTGEDRIFELHIVSLDTSIVTAAHTGIGAKIEFPPTDGVDDIRIEFRRNNADVAGSDISGPFDVKTNTWYKATFRATNMGVASTIPASMTLDEYSADGLTLVSANVFSHSFNIPIEATLTADPNVFPAFRVRNGLRLINAVDDFGFVGVPVPEPASVAMIGLAAAGLLLARREKRAA